MTKKIFLISFLVLFFCGVIYSQNVNAKTKTPTDSSITTAVDTSVKKAPVDDGELIHFNIARVTDVDIKGKGNSLVLSLVGMGVVFTSLFLLFVSFAFLSKMIKKRAQLKQQKANPAKAAELDKEVSIEIAAAIAMAISVHLGGSHDTENAILTIQRASRNYSPWSSKIYNLRHHPRNW
jgi:sodium pump decarboxylase gamma subunit